MKRARKVLAVFSVIACVVLAISLVGVVLNYQAQIRQKEEEYRKVLFQLTNETRIAYGYWENWTLAQKSNPNMTLEQQAFLEQHSELIESLLNGTDPKTLKTIIMHGCQKQESENISLPNAAYTYQKIRDGFAPYEVLMLPEYRGNLNWTETLQWISTDFKGIPICLSVFEGGQERLPDPNVKLTVMEIQQAMAVADVRMIRFAEMVSWYINASEFYQNATFPIEDVRNILEFCKNNNLRVIWSEWKISDNVWPLLNSAFEGYEDIVTFTYQTNNEYDDPFVGFLHATQFKHWGGSIQSWYWEKRTNETQGKMPVELMAEHTVLARNMGAEIIQFEPYWYFFDNEGKPLDTMYTMWSTV